MSDTIVDERAHSLWHVRPGLTRGVGPPKSRGLRVSDWRSEILQAMFWLKNEGFGEVDSALLERFLGVDSHVDDRDLDRLTSEGSVVRVGRLYKLSEIGTRNARIAFAASFKEFTGPVSGECSRAAWCNSRMDT